MGAFIKGFRHNASLGWEKFTSFLPIYGLRGTVALLMKNLLWVEMQYRLEKDLSTGDPTVYPKIPINVVPYSKGFDVGSWDCRDQIARIRGKFALRRFQQRLDRGEVVFVAYLENTVLGFTWVQFPPHIEAGYRLSSDEAYALDSWVFQEYRGQKVYSTISKTLKNYVRQNRPDIKKLVNHVAVKNRAAISGVHKSGYTITRKEISFALFGWYRRLVLRSYPKPPIS